MEPSALGLALERRGSSRTLGSFARRCKVTLTRYFVSPTDTELKKRSVWSSADHMMSRRSALALLGAGAFAPIYACTDASSSLPASDAGIAEPLHYMSLQARRPAHRLA